MFHDINFLQRYNFFFDICKNIHKKSPLMLDENTDGEEREAIIPLKFDPDVVLLSSIERTDTHHLPHNFLLDLLHEAHHQSY